MSPFRRLLPVVRRVLCQDAADLRWLDCWDSDQPVVLCWKWGIGEGMGEAGKAAQ